MIDKIIRLMNEKYMTDISVFDESFLEKSINNRICTLSLEGTTEYLIYLGENSSEQLLLSESLSNTYSEFFRNPLTFHILEQILIPNLVLKKSGSESREIRIWSAGCAEGQEPYSLSILAEDYKTRNHLNVTLRIFATDKSETELISARKGIYHTRTVQNTRLCQIKNYFSNMGEYYSVNDEIKRNVDFSVFDLLEQGAGSPPSSIYGDFDIVMCSNLLFYYKPLIQMSILTRLANSLVTGGYLITGEAEESIIKSFRGFRQYAAPAAIFIKN